MFIFRLTKAITKHTPSSGYRRREKYLKLILSACRYNQLLFFIYNNYNIILRLNVDIYIFFLIYSFHINSIAKEVR